LAELELLTNQEGCCERCGKKKIDCICRFAEFSFSGIISVFTYNEQSKRIIHTLKYEPKSPVSSFLASLMADVLKKKAICQQFDFITEVPMSKEETLRRGHNQSQTLARKIGLLADIPYLESPIVRLTDTMPQHTLSAAKRYENVKNAYALGSNSSIKGNILLVDDVVTTGATLHRCSALLRACGANDVFCLTASTTPIR
jgi:ComF family protein